MTAELAVALEKNGLTLLQQIGSGGFGDVFKVCDRDGNIHSLKLFTVPKKNNPVVAAAYEVSHSHGIKERERTAALFRHPHILQSYSSGTLCLAGRQVAYVLGELVDGPSLEQVLSDQKNQRLEKSKICRLMNQLVSAVAHIHENRYIHNDLKLDNVLIDQTRGGRLVLLDFSNAERTDEKGIVLNTVPALPSKKYRAPEIDQGQKISQRSEVWSLGILLYHIYTGKNPKQESAETGRSLAELVEKHIPRRHQAILKKCLQENPQQRYANACAVSTEFLKANDYYVLLAGKIAAVPIVLAVLSGLIFSTETVHQRMGNYYLNRCTIALEERHDPFAAEKECLTAHSWDQKNPYIILLLGHSYLEQGKYDEAEGVYRRIFGRQDPKAPQPHVSSTLEQKALQLAAEGQGEHAAKLREMNEKFKREKQYSQGHF